MHEVKEKRNICSFISNSDGFLKQEFIERALSKTYYY